MCKTNTLPDDGLLKKPPCVFKNFYLNVELETLNARVPKKAFKNDGGYDVFSPIDFIIESGRDKVLSLELKFEFPENFALLFVEKSGLAINDKITLGARLVDADYRGTIYLQLFNNSIYSVKFQKGDKLAQFIVIPVWGGDINIVEKVTPNNNRGTGGIGSTGR